MFKTSVVKAYVAGKKATGQIGTVSFVKADGTVRKINGVFAPTSKIVGSDRGVAQGKAMEARGQVPIFDLHEMKWKSFYADKVVELS
jgi:hypothetical protein